MAERIFIIDSRQPRLDAAAARRQFSLSLAVGFAVLAAAAIVELQPARSAPWAGPTRHMRAPAADFPLAAAPVGRN